MRRTEIADRKVYWTKNLTYVGILLAIWFIVSYGFGIIFVYVKLMNRLDRAFEVDEQEEDVGGGGSPT
jgi:uncharacterized membrane protein